MTRSNRSSFLVGGFALAFFFVEGLLGGGEVQCCCLVVVVGVVVVAVGLVRSVRERMLVMVSKEVMKEGDASNCNLGDLDKARRNCKAVVVWSRFRLLVEVSLLAGRRGEGLVAGTRGEGRGGR